MKLSVNIEKRYAYIILGLFIIIAGTFVVYAAVDTSQGWHPASQIDFSGVGACSNICTDADTQTLSLDGQTLSLTNGGSVTLPSDDNDWATSGNNIYRVGKVGVGSGAIESPDAYLQIIAPTSGSPPPTIPALIAGGGIEEFNVVVTNIGRVGIGTASPSSKLVVNGEIKASAGTEVYAQSNGCANAGGITFSATCQTISCGEYGIYYKCNGQCLSNFPQTCNNVLKGYLIGVA